MALTISPLLIFTGFIMVFFITKMGSLFLVSQQKLDKLNTVLQENIAGIRVVKAFVRKRFESERFADVNEEYTRTTIDVMQVMAALMPTLTACINIGVVALVWVGGYQTSRGDLTIGEIVAFTNYLLTTMTPLMIMARLSSVMAGGIASAERVQEILTLPPEVKDKSTAFPIPKDALGRIVFEDVTFHYNGASTETVLEHISFSVEPGQIVAILGATGAGKTSLINLIPRFYDVVDGNIKFDSFNIRDVLQDSLLSQVSLVPQESILFSGSVRHNIQYGNPDASEEEVIAVAKVAQAHHFIMELPNGYDTHIEHRGINLSGGQRQRIAIARALLTHPKILILDDSTSSVDVETEGKIQTSLRGWLQNCTTFIVAQRISTVLNADKILVLDKGMIVAQGSHEELIQRSPIYQEIYESQLGDGLNDTHLRANGVGGHV
jgi:ATP-binding cassette subfamily B protein